MTFASCLSDAIGERPDSLGRVSPSSETGDRRHARVVPARHMPLLNELKEFPLAHHRVRQVETGELDLLGVMNPQRFNEPVIQWTVVGELQRAYGMCDL